MDEDELKRRTVDFYTRNAERQDAIYSEKADPEEWPWMPEFVRRVRRGRVLDLGSAGGSHSLYFRRHGLDPVCLDIADPMTRIAGSRGLPAVRADIEALPFADGSFRGVCASTSLLHVAHGRLPTVRDDITRVLQPDGVLLATIKEGEGWDVGPDGRRFTYWRPEEFVEALAPEFRLAWYRSKGGSGTDGRSVVFGMYLFSRR